MLMAEGGRLESWGINSTIFKNSFVIYYMSMSSTQLIY